MNMIFKNIINDIITNYVYNCPEYILDNKIHLLFQLQSAYWYYMDNYCTLIKDLPKMTEVEFMRYLVNHCIFLYIRLPNFNDEYKKWIIYLNKIPVCGSILIDPSFKYCLMLECKFNKNKHIGFPKGKINENEKPIECAIRETMEETGYDIRNSIDETKYIEDFVKGKCVRLYLIFNVKLDTPFYPSQQGEISGYKWHPIDNIPMSDAWSNILFLIQKKVHEEELYQEYGIKKHNTIKKSKKNKNTIQRIDKINKILDKEENKYISYHTKSFLNSETSLLDIII